MTLSVRQQPNGPIWPLGLIVVPTPGTPVGIMSLVDSASVNDPNKATSSTSKEYPPRAQQIIFQGFKAATDGLQVNTGNIYILRRGGAGSANRDDYGTMVAVVTSGGSFVLASAPTVVDVFSPYDFYIDADSAGDSCLVSLIIQ
jgi:hypothetical protein